MVLRGVLRTLPRKLNTPSASLRRSRGASGCLAAGEAPNSSGSCRPSRLEV